MGNNNSKKRNNIEQNKNLFNNIKSKYLLKLLFEYLQQKQLLEIIKYNKKLQKDLNIGKKDYQKYLEIEIEIIPYFKKNQTFINYLKKDKKFFHIYLNDNKKEIKRNYFIIGDNKVKNIKIIIDYQIKS